jgi:hypothetical protein
MRPAILRGPSRYVDPGAGSPIARSRLAEAIAMTARGGPGSPPPWPGDGGGKRLFSLVRGACADADGLPARLEAALRAALGALAAEPELAHRLTVEPYLGEEQEALDAQLEWVGRFGVLLRDAAAADPRASKEPLFLAPFLIGGVRLQIARLVLTGEAPELLRLLPGTLEGLLAYYFEPGEPRVLARAALAHE